MLFVSDRCNQSSSAFFMLSSCRCYDSSMLSTMLTSYHPLSFLGTYSLSMSFLGFKTICIIMCFCCLGHLLEFFSGPLYLCFRVSYEEYSLGIDPFDEIFAMLVGHILSRKTTL